MATFFTIPNQATPVVTRTDVAPWELEKIPEVPDWVSTKLKYMEWVKLPATESLFFTTFEGVSPELRVNDSNPVYRMHGLLVDYDHPYKDECLDDWLRVGYGPFYPSHAGVTYSGHVRLYWAFERPIMLANTEHAKKFCARLAKELLVSQWHPGLDKKVTDPAHFYHVGRRWFPVRPAASVPFNLMQLWAFEACRGLDLDPAIADYDIPLEAIKKEMEVRWPGRWQGAFVLGSRGIRFWDMSADNPTAAVVHRHGMVCFTGPTPFMSWRQLFGPQFVAKFQADRYAQVAERIAWSEDGKFWWRTDDTWTPYAKENLSLLLKKSGFSPKPGSGSNAFMTQIEDVLAMALETRAVKRAQPFLFHPFGIISHRGERVLNISRAKALDPAPPQTGGLMTFNDGIKFFPFVRSLLRTLFVSLEGDDEAMDEQLRHLLAWLKYAYEGALLRQPRAGQAIVIVGPQGKGKNLLSHEIIGGLLGGFEDATSYFVNENQFTDDLVQVPVLTIDDSLGASDYSKHTKFVARLKAYAANNTLRYDKKHAQAGNVPHYGRVIITTNTDAESLRILPQTDMSNKDKISLFMCSDYKIAFDTVLKNAEKIRQELPYFARYLVDQPIPEDLVASEARYGVVPFHHPELLDFSQKQGLAGILEEVLTPFLREYHAQHPTEYYYFGTAADIYRDLSIMNPAVMREFKAHSVGICLGKLAKAGRACLPIQSRHNHLRYWTLGVDFHKLDLQVMRQTVEKKMLKLEMDAEKQKAAAAVTTEVSNADQTTTKDPVATPAGIT